jgi:MHS family citrate/tricarballylate:H+ symporter-like MFS transporter
MPPPPRLSQIAAVAAGNALEFYDFLAYAFFAGEIGRAFFPSADPSASLLASLATFGAGFLMRPVGAVVLGRIGDRHGRKPAMLLSFSLMGLAMVALAAIPSYGRIGMLAPVLVIACRFVQGFALGGEVGPSTAYLIEAAPRHRRGLYVAVQYMGQQGAVLAVGLVGYGLARALSPAALDAWGWRAAFLAGATIIPFGLFLRAHLTETLAAVPPVQPAQPAARSASRPLALVAVLGLAMLAGGTTVTYVLNYLTTYATETLHMPKTLGFAATVTTGLVGVIVSPIGGLLSDRFGRKPVMMIPWAVLLLVTVPAFRLIADQRSAGALLGMAVVLAAANNLAFSAILTTLTEGLPRRIRAGALGLIYAVAISVFGGSTQFTVAWLTRLFHNPLAPAWYMTAGVALSLAAMALQAETAPGSGRRDGVERPG